MTDGAQTGESGAARTALTELPMSSMNPLLNAGAFFAYCKKHFRSVVFEDDFREKLDSGRISGSLLPAWLADEVPFYSTFQIWEYSRIEAADSGKGNDRFRSILRLLVKIQDWYFPEVWSDGRWGLIRNHQGQVAIGESFFVTSQAVLLSSLRRSRLEKIARGSLVPKAILEQSGNTVRDVENWASRFEVDALFEDPIPDWRRLVRFVAHDKRDRLKFEARLAHTFYEMAELLEYFLEDLSAGSEIPLTWKSRRKLESEWETEHYGAEAVRSPYRTLEYLTNGFELNPKPRAIILTEGEEFDAIRRVFEYYDFDPDLLGVEFRPMGGVGRFSLKRWQAFVEYMHEKQVLVYFIVDREGHAASEARKLLETKRQFRIHGLARIVPRSDRIVLWRSSFEQANFTDAEISRALASQGLAISTRDVQLARKDKLRRKGLIAELSVRHGIRPDKKRLAIDLAVQLLEHRTKKKSGRLRPVEKFVSRAGRLIVRNYQPTSKQHQEANFATGMLG